MNRDVHSVVIEPELLLNKHTHIHAFDGFKPNLKRV